MQLTKTPSNLSVCQVNEAVKQDNRINRADVVINLLKSDVPVNMFRRTLASVILAIDKESSQNIRVCFKPPQSFCVGICERLLLSSRSFLMELLDT